MSAQAEGRTPVEIALHKKSRLLSIRFSDGKRFDLPCEYLRVFSRAAEVRAMQHPETGKADVNIEGIEPQGQYAVRLVFDDCHDTGIYSWDTLYSLGENYEANWAGYLRRLEELDYTRTRPERRALDEGQRDVTLLYFAYLVKKLDRENEQIRLPAEVADVQSLLKWLRGRDPDIAHLFEADAVRVTVNKQFCEPFTRLGDGDEIAIVPASPVPPAKPR
jgi:DUF971 family protein/molybdopterin converting factor small subunit